MDILLLPQHNFLSLPRAPSGPNNGGSKRLARQFQAWITGRSRLQQISNQYNATLKSERHTLIARVAANSVHSCLMKCKRFPKQYGGNWGVFKCTSDYTCWIRNKNSSRI